jgi:phosphoserine phosphatase RsbU/P
MRKTALLLFALLAAVSLPAQTTLPAWQQGISELNSNWRMQSGDNPAWADPDFDDSAWQPAAFSMNSKPEPGWRWYRLDLRLPADHPPLALIVGGPVNAYEVYANGQRLAGAHILWSQRIRLGKENLFLLPEVGDRLTIALRVHQPDVLTQIYGIAVNQVLIGTVPAITAERKVAEDKQVLGIVASAGINASLVIAGLGALLLYLGERSLREYLWLGLYLIASGLGGAGFEVFAGVVPIWVNSFVGDPCSILQAVFQIEFTFTFARRKPSRPWRWYEGILLLFPLLSLATSFGLIPGRPYLMAEGLSQLPMAVLLPIWLTIWFRNGNREAGWLIVPSLLAGISTPINDVLLLSGLLGWQTATSVATPMTIGIVPVELTDFFSFLFLLSIGVVMFLRFARINVDRGRTTAEFDAARQVQQQLIPMEMPDLAGCSVQAAYIPAAEVGGDFYQVLEQPGNASLIVLGDVSGKGLKAAMTATLALGALRALASEALPPAALLTRLNRELARSSDGGFITCIALRISASGEAAIANAGHLSPYRNGAEIPLPSGLPLGITADAVYEEVTLKLAPNDRLTLLSDGVVEAQNPAGELFGFDRTAAISTQSADQIALAAQSFGQEDDITVLTVQKTALTDGASA